MEEHVTLPKQKNESNNTSLKMYDRFTDRSRKVMKLAQGIAKSLGSQSVGSIELLFAISKEGQGVGAHVLKNVGYNFSKLKIEYPRWTKKYSKQIRRFSEERERNLADIPVDQIVKDIVVCSIESARGFGDNFVGTEHLLCGIWKHQKNDAFLFLKDLDIPDLLHEIKLLLGQH